ncbi:Oxygen regulatory protein NreC [Fundidesulfovibrio magnetotacticus]|uniref:Oxygen regulatory protein NreC n=1 Tax=Fundidesulfovibrio magnetotacticus TaxID=2730080 RepID=A0A6V8LT04_9BACT|nr:response regulator transcription factor [Fundidesulfovibrio magnetotacticus]GFK95593.1 Oxygen regulatory protein NreC [Fundidesulfovibrio magnetotacticus]
MKKTTLLIAEDMEIVRKGIKSLILSNTDFEVCGEAADGQTAVNLALTLMPDVVIMDLSLPRMDGTEAIAEIKRRLPRTRILALTGHGKENFLTAAIQAGVDGYLLKQSSDEELYSAIAAVAAGQGYFSREVTAMLAQACRTGNKPPSPLEMLSRRERQVLKLAAKGLTNKDISDAIFVSVKTVEKHKTNLKKKLGLRSSLELAAFCLEQGLLDEAD